MSRGGIKITRSGDDVEHTASEIPSWMSEFASKAEQIIQAEERQKEAVTVVDHARERQDSIYQQMYAIMNGKKPLYSSVEEAVIDYQKKTGLNDYIKQIQSESSVKEAASQIISAAGSDCGCSPDCDCEDCQAEKKTPKSEDVKLFTTFPNTERYVNNVLDTNPKLSVPAVIHMIAENFEADGVDSNHLDDDNLMRFISNQIKLREKPDLEDYSSIGKDVGLDPDQGDDTFLGILRDNGGF